MSAVMHGPGKFPARRSILTSALGATVLVVLALSGCDVPRQDAATGARPDRALVEAGRAVYNFRCYFCHGYSGDARTLAATFLDPPPRDFVAATPQSLPLPKIVDAVRQGRPGTSMKSFAGVIGPAEQEAVAAFVYDEFVLRKAPNTRYHTVENGWPDHDRYRDAFPFARGEIALSEPPEQLTPSQARGRRLFVESCISCHDRGKPDGAKVTLEGRPLSYPRAGYDHRNPTVDAATSATPYRIHDIAPTLVRPTPAQKRGERLFQDNCSFCHAADGTGKNWIGSFLEPHPRNLADPDFARAATPERLRNAIRDGLKDTSMPAWKSVLSDEQINDVIAYVEGAFIEKAKAQKP
jgi:cytochrome c oxidase cbb3-type subunit 3